MDPGTALGVVSLSFQVFAGCVEGFKLLTGAHNLGKDASYLSTMLELEEYRFIQWAEVVGLLAEPHPAVHPRLNQDLASQLMVQLEGLLKEPVKRLRERYGLKLSVEQPAEIQPAAKDDDVVESILWRAVIPKTRGKILTKAGLIQKSNGLPKRLWWAAVDKDKLQQLVDDIRAIINGLWALLEPVQQSEAARTLNEVLHRVISLCEEQSALNNIQLALRDLKMDLSALSGTEGQNSIMPSGFELVEVAASLKACRLNDASQAQKHLLSTSQEPSVARKLKLQPHLLKDFSPRSADGLCGTARYNGTQTWVEHKIVPRSLRQKLVSRVESLSTLLSLPKDSSFLTLPCLGYFESADRFSLVYGFPWHSSSESKPISLLDLLRSSVLHPTVSQRMRIARDLCTTILTIHTSGWVHKDIRSENVLFFPEANASESDILHSKPYLTGFYFSRLDSPSEISENPGLADSLDPYTFPDYIASPDGLPFSKTLDMYALSTVLIELAEWRPLKHIVRKCVELQASQTSSLHSRLLQIRNWLEANEINNGMVGFRMGEVYAKAVQEIFRQSKQEDLDGDCLTVFINAVHSLEKCVI